MGNPFSGENEYCKICKDYNSLIKRYVKDSPPEAGNNTLAGLITTIDLVLSEIGDKNPNCDLEACDEVLNLYDRDSLKKMSEIFEKAQIGSESDVRVANKMVKELRHKYVKKEGG